MKKAFFTLALMLVTFTANAQTTPRGDLNGDGVVSVSDVTELVNIILGGDAPQSYLTCPDDQHPHLIDLGLPSGTKWACCNVGAGKPEAYGGYYAWGETKEKSIYYDVTYLYATGVDEGGDGWYDDWHDNTNTSGVWQNLGSDIAGTQYDVAHMKWGGSWVMPSIEQQEELINNCTNEWATMNGVNGCKFTSKTNGGSIFLPAAGDRCDSDLYDAGLSGGYWSSTKDPSRTSRAFGLFFNSIGASTEYDRRCWGHGVRPVIRN